MDRDEYKIETLPEDWWDRFVKKIKGGDKTQKPSMAETTHDDAWVHYINPNDLPRGKIRNSIIERIKKRKSNCLKN